MMLAEKYAFEAKRLVKDPKIEVAREQGGHVHAAHLAGRHPAARAGDDAR